MRTEESRQVMKNSVSRMVFVGISVLLQALWVAWLTIRLSNYSTWISLAMSLLAFAMVLRVYGLHINSAYKISWIILILLFPIFGLCMYLLFGHTGASGLPRKRFAQASAATTAQMPKGEEALAALKKVSPVLAGQAVYLQSCDYPPYAGTKVTYYGDTCVALEAQKEALRGAKHFIFMEYHAIENSTAWQGLEDILAQRAAEGVDVRVFYDDMGSIGFLNPTFIKQLNSRGIQCRVFNPLMPLLNVFMNNRDHRKITVVDGKVGFTGGYNLADEYFNLTQPYGQWKDSGVRLEGPAVRSLTLIFLEMWQATSKQTEDITPFLPQVAPAPDAQGFALPYADSPLDDERVGENTYLNMIKGATRYVYMATPYLIISDEMQREIALAARRGVDVRIVTPGIPDKKLVYRLTRSFYAQLASQGVRIYEYTPGFIHAKQFVADDEVAAVGTINMDFRSLYLHFENGCWFNGPAAVQVREDFDALFAVSTEVSAQYATGRSLALRGTQCVLRLFGPLM